MCMSSFIYPLGGPSNDLPHNIWSERFADDACDNLKEYPADCPAAAWQKGAKVKEESAAAHFEILGVSQLER